MQSKTNVGMKKNPPFIIAKGIPNMMLPCKPGNMLHTAMNRVDLRSLLRFSVKLAITEVCDDIDLWIVCHEEVDCSKGCSPFIDSTDS